MRAIVDEDLVVVAVLSTFEDLGIYFCSQIDHQVRKLLLKRDKAVNVVSGQILHAACHAIPLRVVERRKIVFTSSGQLEPMCLVLRATIDWDRRPGLGCAGVEMLGDFVATE